MLGGLLQVLAPTVIRGALKVIHKNAPEIADEAKAVASGALIETDDDMLRERLDDFLDWIERKVEESTNKLDDMTILPFIKLIRDLYDIPDGDD